MFGLTNVSNARFENYSICGMANLTRVVCTNKLLCSGSVDIDSSQLNQMISSGTAQLTRTQAKEVRSSGSLQAHDCCLGSVRSSGSTVLARCQDIGEIAASGSFDMIASKVHGKVVLSGTEAIIIDSKISGELECAEERVAINRSTVDRIVMKPIFGSQWSFFGFKMTVSGLAGNSPRDQTIVLEGKNCHVGSIVFQDGAKGSVVLRDGASVASVQGGRLVES